MKTPNTTTLFNSIKDLILESRKQIVRNINSTITLTYYQIGRYITEDALKGKGRADYSKQTFKNLSSALTKEFGKGYSVDNLENFRRFYVTYQTRISETPSWKSSSFPNSETVSRKWVTPFPLGWSHYVL